MSAANHQCISVLSTLEKPFHDQPDVSNPASLVFAGDAGTQSKDYYAKKLGPFRSRCRNALLPLIQAETPILARIQKKLRHPFLDTYFMSTANLGSHTFYVLFLPLSFWLGFPLFGWKLFVELALGVYITNYFKDFFCLPRPLSPPLHRLTMSKDVALEYGFPSTHTANAVSVFLLVADTLYKNYFSSDPAVTKSGFIFLNIINVIYILSLVIGRIYCGMHGFLDLLGGSVVGVFMYWAGPIAVNYIYKAVWSHSIWILLIIPVIFLLINQQPKPADKCPCFDDSIAFLGVLLGLVLSEWTFLNVVFNRETLDIYTDFRASQVSQLDRFYMFAKKRYYQGPKVLGVDRPGLSNCILRVVLGIAMVLVWKTLMKKLSMAVLPFVWRQLGIEKQKKGAPANTGTKNEDGENLQQLNTGTVNQATESTFKQRLNANKSTSREQSDTESPEEETQISFRTWYEAEVISKIIVYAGIAWVVLCPSRYLFAVLNI